MPVDAAALKTAIENTWNGNGAFNSNAEAADIRESLAQGIASPIAAAIDAGVATDGVALTSDAPQPVGSSNIVGVGAGAAHSDHVHAHGNQAGGGLHSAAVAGSPGTNGFMTGVQAQQLYDAVNNISALTSYLAGLTTALVPDSLNKRYVTDAHLVILGNTSGVNTGDQTNVSGNAGTATVLQTSRNIAGVAFNGGADISIPFSGLTGGIDDTQHGSRGGGSLHAAAVAGGASGFMTGAQVAQLRDAGWSLANRPATPHAYDDEFNSGNTISGSWTVNATVSGSAVDPYANFTTAATVRLSHNVMRPDWLLMQPCSDATIQFIHKSITVPTDMLVWARLSFTSRWTTSPLNNDHSIGIGFAASSGGALDVNNNLGIYLVETDANEYAIQFQTVTAGVISFPEKVLNVENIVQFSFVLMQKIGTTYHFWVGSPTGNWVHLGSTTYAVSMDRVYIACSNNGTTTPGNMILGIDFIRFLASAGFVP